MIHDDIYVELSYEEYADRILGGWTNQNSMWGFSIFKNRHKIKDSQIEIDVRNVNVKTYDKRLVDHVATINIEVHFKLTLESGQLGLEKARVIQHHLLSDKSYDEAVSQSHSFIMRRLHEFHMVESVQSMLIQVQTTQLAELQGELCRLKSKNQCSKCNRKEKQIALSPCGHCLCTECAATAYRVNCCPVITVPNKVFAMQGLCASNIKKKITIK